MNAFLKGHKILGTYMPTVIIIAVLLIHLSEALTNAVSITNEEYRQSGGNAYYAILLIVNIIINVTLATILIMTSFFIPSVLNNIVRDIINRVFAPSVLVNIVLLFIFCYAYLTILGMVVETGLTWNNIISGHKSLSNNPIFVLQDIMLTKPKEIHAATDGGMKLASFTLNLVYSSIILEIIIVLSTLNALFEQSSKKAAEEKKKVAASLEVLEKKQAEEKKQEEQKKSEEKEEKPKEKQPETPKK